MRGTAYQLQCLWLNGTVSPLWTGYTLIKLWQYLAYATLQTPTIGRMWIEREDQPARVLKMRSR